jgi:hypothetical protein
MPLKRIEDLGIGDTITEDWKHKTRGQEKILILMV